MDDSEYKREKRKQARLERLMAKNPTCLICGENDSCVLDRHHPGGHKYTDETVMLCRNHHRKAEELRKDHPPELTGPPSELECDGRFLLGIGDLLSLVEHVPSETVGLIRQTAVCLIERDQLARDRDEVRS
jgi:hypothetical protein